VNYTETAPALGAGGEVPLEGPLAGAVAGEGPLAGAADGGGPLTVAIVGGEGPLTVAIVGGEGPLTVAIIGGAGPLTVAIAGVAGVVAAVAATEAGKRPDPFGVSGVGYFRISTLTALTALISRSNNCGLGAAQKSSEAETATRAKSAHCWGI
jgi:hypothetical protein